MVKAPREAGVDIVARKLGRMSFDLYAIKDYPHLHNPSAWEFISYDAGLTRSHTAFTSRRVWLGIYHFVSLVYYPATRSKSRLYGEKMFTRIRNAIVIATFGAVLSACGTTQMNMIDVQTATAKTLGLASSDEITISNVKYGQKNALGGQQVGYDATTSRGRRFSCTAFMIPGLTPLNPPTFNNGECHPRG
ncbi:LysR family transcriptional regulator [Caballeronia sordidicola]|uniref:LysR family transcriptional regulator n=2 Tax=Caballeronia sordidicola TaxID=196367 RepID=A0A158GC61_CABSO|nr:LysR family transcriptional regulator [Caballeronia sordidicola]